MVGLLVVLVILLSLGILGTVVKGLLWLTAVAAVLIVLGLAFGWWKLRGSGRT